MPRPKKRGPVERPQVTLRGRQLEAMKAICDLDECSFSEAVRKALDMWLRSPEGKERLREHYGYDPSPLAPVVEHPARRKSHQSNG